MYEQQDIIERYRQADFENRLSLFLECPAFRDDFLHIDQTDAKMKETGKIASRSKTGSGGLLTRAANLFRG